MSAQKAKSVVETEISSNLHSALNYLKFAKRKANDLVECEKMLNQKNRDALYGYGLDRLNFHLVKISNCIKSLESIVNKAQQRVDQCLEI